MRKQSDLYWVNISLNKSRNYIFAYDPDRDLFTCKEDQSQPFTGQICFGDNSVVWILNGKIHHPSKPAHYDGSYWLEGQEYSFNDFYNRQKDTQYASGVLAYVLASKGEQ